MASQRFSEDFCRQVEKITDNGHKNNWCETILSPQTLCLCWVGAEIIPDWFQTGLIFVLDCKCHWDQNLNVVSTVQTPNKRSYLPHRKIRDEYKVVLVLHLFLCSERAFESHWINVSDFSDLRVLVGTRGTERNCASKLNTADFLKRLAIEIGSGSWILQALFVSSHIIWIGAWAER